MNHVKELFWSEYASPMGTLLLMASDSGIYRIVLPRKSFKHCLNNLGKRNDILLTNKDTSLIKQCKKQLSEYFVGKRSHFYLDLDLEGTPFQKKVWRALRSIEYGHTKAYVDIAKKIGNPKAIRAVGMANNKNPIPLVIPCHRVIGKNGSLVGYGGGLELKSNLLELEKTFMKKFLNVEKSSSLAHASL